MLFPKMSQLCRRNWYVGPHYVEYVRTDTPGHGWLGGCSPCRGKSFAQETGSDRSHNPCHSVHRCTAPGGQGQKKRLQDCYDMMLLWDSLLLRSKSFRDTVCLFALLLTVHDSSESKFVGLHTNV